MRKSVFDSLIASALLILIFILPRMATNLGELELTCILLILKVVLCLYLFIALQRNGYFDNGRQNPHWKHVGLLCPTFVAFVGIALFFIFSGYIDVMGIFLSYNGELSPSLNLFLSIVNWVVSAIYTELFFRLYFFNQIRTQNRIVRILASAGIEALFSILLLMQNFPLQAVALDMLVTFLFGIILGTLMEYGHSIYICIGVHIVFNFAFQDMAYVYALIGFDGIFLDYIFLNPLLWLVIGVVYIGVIYAVYFRKKEYN